MFINGDGNWSNSIIDEVVKHKDNFHPTSNMTLIDASSDKI